MAPVRRTLRLACTALVVVAVTAACGGGDDGPRTEAQLIEDGEKLFHGEAACAICHGDDLRGTTMGPPLLHEIYEPGHHPDEAFHAAVRNGVQPHHWDFGPMPPMPSVSRSEVDAIVAYVRAEQRGAGIGG
jgi:mono/diheme cytochrome c family protein